MPQSNVMLDHPVAPVSQTPLPKTTFGRAPLDADASNAINPPLKAGLLLLVHHDAPRMLLVAVHDVAHPALDLGRVLAALALDHGNVDVVVAVADLRDGADEELGSSVSNQMA